MEKITLTGLWKNEDKEGKTFLSGQISPGAVLFIMQNGFKEKDSKQPDYIAYIAKAKKKEDSNPESGKDL